MIMSEQPTRSLVPVSGPRHDATTTRDPSAPKSDAELRREATEARAAINGQPNGRDVYYRPSGWRP